MILLPTENLLCRTRTPIRVKHKLVVKVFFSVIGETLSGAPISDGPGNVGDLRMLVVNLPELVPSVSSCVTLRLHDKRLHLLTFLFFSAVLCYCRMGRPA